MMPSDQDKSRVAGQIESLEERPVEVRLGDVVTEIAWRVLPPSAQDTSLEQAVDWTGFTPEERGDVTRRVIEREGLDFLMDDIELPPEIPVSEEFDRVLSEIEERWWKPPETSVPVKPPDALGQVLDYIKDDYELRMMENSRPRDTDKGRSL